MRSSLRTESSVECCANVDLHFSKSHAVCFNVFMTTSELKPAEDRKLCEHAARVVGNWLAERR
jgi:hypothetical protein